MINENLLLAFADTVELIPQNQAGIRVAPDKFIVIPYGKNKYTIDDEQGEFDFDEEDADQIINEFQSRGKDLMIDIEHASLIPGKPAPAYGWVNKLEKSKEGLLAKLANWTDDAREYLEKGKYRYHSPVIYFDKQKTSHPSALQSITLTNHPALHNLTSLVAANDTSGIEDIDGNIKDFKDTISHIKNSIDGFSKGKTVLSLNDTRHLSMLQESFENNLDKFTSYVNESKAEDAEEIIHSFTNKLFLSDISNSATEIAGSYSGEEAISQLIALKESPDISSAEIQFIDALIQEIQEDVSEMMFNDSSNNKTKKGADKVKKRINMLKAFADNNLEEAMALEQEIQAEELPEDTGEVDMAVLDEIKNSMVSLLDIVNKMANAVGVTATPAEGEVVEEMDTVALADKTLKGVTSVVDALNTISSAYDAKLDLNNIKAFTDAVIFERLATPDNEEVKRLSKQIAMSDLENRTQKAQIAVKAALDAGTITKSREAFALKYATENLEAFNDRFSPEKGIPIVPTGQNADTEINDKPDADKKAPLALSDKARETWSACGYKTDDAIREVLERTQKK